MIIPRTEQIKATAIANAKFQAIQKAKIPRHLEPKMINIRVITGIGDLSWVLVKLSKLSQTKDWAFDIQDYAPQRAKPFIDLCPMIKKSWYSHFDDSTKEWQPASKDLSTLEDGGGYYLKANVFLEQGMRIEDIWPKQEPDYHYEVRTLPEHQREAKWHCLGDLGLKVGFYCSSNIHADNTQFWSVQEWFVFFKAVEKLCSNITWYAIGAPYDDRTRQVHDALQQSGSRVESCLGTHIGTTIEIIRKMDYFFSFPSGLGILGDVVDTPTTMWLWKDIKGLKDGYADPQSIASHRHVNRLYGSVREELEAFKAGGARWIEEAAKRK